MLFDEINTIDVVDWHEYVFVLLKELLPLFSLLDLSLFNKFEHLVNIQIRRDKLSCMSGTGLKDSRLSIVNERTSEFEPFFSWFGSLFIFGFLIRGFYFLLISTAFFVLRFVRLSQGVIDFLFIIIFSIKLQKTLFSFSMLLNLLITIGGRFTGTAGELNDVNISSLKRFSNTISFRDIREVMGDALH